MRLIVLTCIAAVSFACDDTVEPVSDADSSFDSTLDGPGGSDGALDDPLGDSAASDGQVDGHVGAPAGPLSVLVFTKTTGFRHGSIADGLTALNALAADRGWVIADTEDASQISSAGLASIDVLVFLNTTGDPLDANQQTALETWVRAGGGWVGVHGAADCEYDWPWYRELVGAWFQRHPRTQEASLTIENRSHPATSHLDATWMRRDEWYDFRTNPRGEVDVLITIDENSCSGGGMGADHPITWAKTIDNGRSFYTALGHTSETYSEPQFRTMLAEAIIWAAQ